MANVDFEAILNTLKDQLTQLAVSTVKNYAGQAKADAQALLNSIEQNLRIWTLQLANGLITKDDFEFLVLGQKDLVAMNALKQVGLAQIRVDEFKNSVLNLIINTITGVVKI